MKTVLLICLGALGLATGGCTSFRFNRAWREADPSQKWSGRWKSSLRGNGGELRAVVKSDPSGRELDVFFQAHWHGFVTAYPVPLQQEAVSKASGQRAVRGRHDLQSFIGGGSYSYSGILSREEFKVHYESVYDTGDFLLRPAPDRPNP